MDGQTALQGSEVNQTQGWQYTVAAYQSAPESFARSAEAMVKVGQAYLEGRLPGPAEECFRSALKRDPAYSRAHYYLGYLYSRQGRYREAILEFGKCLAAQPRNDSVYAELGLVYFKQGQVGEARALWQQGLMLANEEARLSELIHTLSYSVILDGEQRVVPNLCRMADLATTTSLKQALSYLERAQLLEPFNPQVFATYARVFAAAGQPTQAMTAWEETIRLAPAEPSYQADLAEFLLSQGKYKEARAWAERVVASAPNEAGYWLLLARAEEQAGNTLSAEKHLKTAHDLDPEQPAINYELGHLLWQEKKIPPALCYLRKAARAGHEQAKVYLASLSKQGRRPIRPATLAEGGNAVV